MLKGTEKQVNWASAIRKDRLKVWQASAPDSFKELEVMLTQQGVASWWIASKDKSLEEVSGQLRGGGKQETPGKETTHSAPLKVGMRKAEEVWETVVTASGFTRSGPARDMVTGAIVIDASLPF